MALKDLSIGMQQEVSPSDSDFWSVNPESAKNYENLGKQVQNKVDDVSDVGTISTDDAITKLNNDKKKLDEMDSLTMTPDNMVKTDTGLRPATEEELRAKGKLTEIDKGAKTFEETYELFGNDFSDITKNADGTFTPSAKAYERIGIKGMSEDTGLQGDLQELDNTLTTLASNFLSYNVENDPAYQAEVQNITQQYDKMRKNMNQVNESRKKALNTLGYRTGSTQYAGAIQLGIVGEEIKQGDERIMEIARQESAAKSAARKAFKDGKYSEFAQKMDTLDKLRDNKAEELKIHNEKLAEANRVIEEKAKQDLEVKKYQQTLKTNDIKEYEYAQENGFDGSYLDYLTDKANLKKTTSNMPSSYQEWTLAGGKEGTGKTYAEYLQKEGSKGPSSYQEWTLAGGKEGTGKTYAEFIDKDIGDGMNDKQKAIFNQIVNKYSVSPLIAAKDRTIVLENIVKKIKENPNDGALQLGLVYSYVQALDTYQSAVREGELALVNSIDSSYGKIKNSIEKIQNGQIVREDVAKNIADAAESLVNTINQGAENKEKMYKSQARVNGIQDYWDDFVSGFKGETNNIEYETEIRNMIDTGKLDEESINSAIDYWEAEGLEWGYEDVYNLYEQDFNNGGGGTPKASGMRTDRHNNPTALMWTPGVEKFFKEKGYKVAKGDIFPEGGNYSLDMSNISNPVEATIDYIDNYGFYYKGKQRWSHTGMSESEWNNLSKTGKKNVVKKMYQAEGNKGALNKYFV